MDSVSENNLFDGDENAINGWSKIFWTKCLFTFGPLGSISNESKT